MTWYIVKTPKIKQFKKYVKSHYKKSKVWIPPKEVFDQHIFFQTDSPIKPSKYFCFKLLTADAYKNLTEKESNFIGLQLEDDIFFKIGDKVKVTSPMVCFSGEIVKIFKHLVQVKGKLRGKNIKLSIPKEYVERK